MKTKKISYYFNLLMLWYYKKNLRIIEDKTFLLLEKFLYYDKKVKDLEYRTR
jgi:hypothetical protein